MISAEQLNKCTNFDSIVIVNNAILLSKGNRVFIDHYKKYGYGFLYSEVENSTSDESINVIVPNPPSINSLHYRHYVNIFSRDCCRIIKISDFNSLLSMPLKERMYLFHLDYMKVNNC